MKTTIILKVESTCQIPHYPTLLQWSYKRSDIPDAKCKKEKKSTTYTVLVEVKFESSYYSISKKNQKAQLHKQKTTTLFSTSLKPDMLNYSIGQLHKPGETKMNKTIS